MRGFEKLKIGDIEARNARIGQGGAALKATPPAKYRNEKCVVDGERFDSKREAAHWQQLRLLERAGEITDLQRQVEYPLYCSTPTPGVLVQWGVYIADFVFRDPDGRVHIQDVKGGTATRTQVYQNKKRIVQLQTGLVIEEV